MFMQKSSVINYLYLMPQTFVYLFLTHDTFRECNVIKDKI